jgi:mRNA interferase MazF
VKRGEIRWYTFRLPDKRRPVLVLTRSDVIDRLNEIIAVPATRTIRGLTTEVVLTADDGMPGRVRAEFRSRVAGTTESNWSSLVQFGGRAMG